MCRINSGIFDLFSLQDRMIALRICQSQCCRFFGCVSSTFNLNDVGKFLGHETKSEVKKSTASNAVAVRLRCHYKR